MTEGTCWLAWKQRTGFGKLLFKNSWEQRWVVLSSGQLSYYVVGEEDGDPRGAIDLSRETVNIQVTSKLTTDAPTTHEVDVTASIDGEVEAEEKHWKICFDSQQDLMKFIKTVHDTVERLHPETFLSKDNDRFEHEFQTGDHIYRWEMIVCPPVIYPIQIHGIVLEAGRNCVVVADFGLTGYGRKEGDDFNHADDRHANIILTAWKKLRPTEDQRLNVVTITDPMELRKWTRANYEEGFFEQSSKKKGKFSKLLGRLKTSPRSDDTSSSRTSEEAVPIREQAAPSENGDAKNTDNVSLQQQQQPKQLPKSDPTQIVLARAHFLLEFGETLLPPYHVFYSNSECIAVWCKTGRWSTLQTAVFLSTTSVGGAKSATMATLGVAAAHAVLAPVVAVGGLIWVSAPMVILKKSREKWEESTRLLTELFWAWAPSAVIVAAIEHWSDLSSDQPREIVS